MTDRFFLPPNEQQI
jgi:hypothetical protein